MRGLDGEDVVRHYQPKILPSTGDLLVDDGGTGYSSMAYLKNLPVDEFKIDRSFISGVSRDPNDAVITQSATDVSHNLALTIVAAGVENATHLAALETVGVGIAQGFHLGRPMPEGLLQTWISNRAHTPDPLEKRPRNETHRHAIPSPRPAARPARSAA